METAEEEPTELIENIKDHPVVTSTVFADRAEVSRIVKAKPSEGAGSYVLQVKGLVQAADPDSIRVKAESTGCEILEVTFGVHHEAVKKEESQAVLDAKTLVEEKEQLVSQKQSELSRIAERDDLVQSFMKKEMVLVTTQKSIVDSKKESQTNETSCPVSKVSAVRELLQFHEEHGKSTDEKRNAVARQYAEAKLHLEEAKEALRQCRKNDNSQKSGVSRDVSIIFNAPSDAEVILRLTYNVSKAGWSPCYDVRVSESSDGSQAMQLTYFGVVRQNTDEDWTSAQLSLSTATPSVGGTPPAPPTKVVKYKTYSQGYHAQKVSFQQQEQIPMQSQMMQIPMQSQMNFLLPADTGRRHRRRGPGRHARGYHDNSAESMSGSDDSGDDSLSAEELEDSDDGPLRDDLKPSAGESTNVSESGGGSSTFRIERRTTILSDNKDHKVSIAVIELSPQFRYFATPSLEAKAYLQVRAINNSLYSLLASDKVSVFFDGSYVCNTNLKQIMPGESFSVFLGTDVTVKVEHKLVKKSSNEGTAATFMAKKVDSRQDFEYLTLLHNTKTREVEITVVQLLPRSSDEKITVDLILPKPSALAESGSGAAEGQLKTNSVMRNKVTNNIVFSKKLAPQEKVEIPFAYSVQWPHDQQIVIN